MTLLTLALCAAIGGPVVVSHIDSSASRSTARAATDAPAHIAQATSQPNIVFVLTDDLSMDLLPYMPVVQQMERNGFTFNDYFVSDSLCCPSRASIFTGNLPHTTTIFNNTGNHGGFRVFHQRGEENDTFAVALQEAGYRTAMMGKYLNGYLQPHNKGGDPSLPTSYVPPGWDEWDVAGFGYPEFNYSLNENGTIVNYGNSPQDYLTDVLAEKGVNFINTAAQSGQPFFMELATFAPHSPYVPAPRDSALYPNLIAPRPPNFDVLPANPPQWLRGFKPLSQEQIARINEVFRLRVQDVQAVDDLLTTIQTALKTDGLAGNTYIVFSSDNGLHNGNYRLMPGKMTAFDTDIHVPLVITGPGVPHGASTNDLAENIDLADTFAAIGGATMPDDDDGTNLLPLIHGAQPSDWRNAILVEHEGRKVKPGDPDYQPPVGGNPDTYEAMRTSRFLYVQYTNGGHEFYDLAADPNELDNVYDLLTPAEKQMLTTELEAIHHCSGGTSCWTAMHVSPQGLP